MSTWLAGLGALSKSAAEGVIRARQTKFAENLKALAQRVQELQTQGYLADVARRQQEFELRLREAARPQIIGIPRVIPGKGLVAITRDPNGAISTQVLVPETDDWASLQNAIGLLSPELQAPAGNLLASYKSRGDYAGAEKLVSSLLTRRPPSQTELQKMQDRAKMADQLGLKGRERNAFVAGSKAAQVFIGPTGGIAGGGIVDLAQDVASGQMSLKDLPVKQRAAVATYMRQHGLKAPAVTKVSAASQNALTGLQVLEVALHGDPSAPDPEEREGLVDTLGILDNQQSRLKVLPFLVDPTRPPGLFQQGAMVLAAKILSPEEYRYVVQYNRAAGAIQALRQVTGIPRATQALFTLYAQELASPLRATSKARGMYQIKQIDREIRAAEERLGVSVTTEPVKAGEPSPSQQLEDALKAIGKP